MAKKLQEIADEEKDIPQEDPMGATKAVRVLSDLIENHHRDKEAELETALDQIRAHHAILKEALDRHEEILNKILSRPDPVFPEIKFPEPPKFPKFPDIPEPKDFTPIIQELIEAIHNEGSQTREAIANVPKPEEIETPLQTEELKKAKSAGGAVRRTAQWNIFTFPQLPGTRPITNPSGDGVTFYLSNAVVSNSETVRLNGGLPLSQGVDYTLTGNKIVFVQNQTGAQIEVRGQNR